MAWTLTWDEATAAGPAVAGGKGWNLGRLHRYGFPIPHGFVVTEKAYREHLLANDLLHKLQEVGDPLEARTGALLTEIQNAIAAAPLPTSIAAAIQTSLQGVNGPVAVRSSATAEDSAAASFAGIHRSLLNLHGADAVLEAVRLCYASLWTPQAVAYRRRLGLADDDVSAAVVILEMVGAQAAGVAFSCEPRTGRRDLFTISANWGIGESVVSGEAEPDEYEVDATAFPPTVRQVRIGRKAKQTRLRPDGGTELVAAPANADRPALTTEQIVELASLTGRVHDALGSMTEPQDLEWAFDGARFWLLQSRPVTRLPEPRLPGTERFPTIWSNANLRDVMPGVQSPLGCTLFRSMADTLMRTPFVLAGYPLPEGVLWTELFHGRAYFNLTALQWALYDAFGFLPHETNRTIGGHQPAIEVEPHPFVGPAAPRRILGYIRMVVAGQKALRRAPRAFAQVEAWCQQQEAVALHSRSDAELIALLQAVQRETLSFIPLFQTLNSATAGTMGTLMRQLEPRFGERADALLSGLLAGRTSVTSAEQGTKLVELGKLALQDPDTTALFSRPDEAPSPDELAGTAWGAQFQAYLAEYGHRGVYELEIANPRWREDPTYLLETVRSQVLAGQQIDPVGQGHAARRQEAERKVYGRMGRAMPRGLLTAWMVSTLAQASEGREMAKSLLVRVISVARMVVLEVAKRLVDRGLILAADDIFYLTTADLEALMHGRPVGPLAHLIADRRRQRAEWEALPAPNVIMAEGDGVTPAAEAPLPTGGSLRGLGVAGGRVTAVARLVRHPHEGARLGPGEILVAPSTDPAWTPLFLRASALVAEVGGHLSHGSIVAREYGIPAVVNVSGALTAIQDGHVITVDGNRGEVWLAEQ